MAQCCPSVFNLYLNAVHQASIWLGIIHQYSSMLSTMHQYGSMLCNHGSMMCIKHQNAVYQYGSVQSIRHIMAQYYGIFLCYLPITIVHCEASTGTPAPSPTLMPSVPLSINGSLHVTGSTVTAMFQTNKPVVTLRCRLVGVTQFQDYEYDYSV